MPDILTDRRTLLGAGLIGAASSMAVSGPAIAADLGSAPVTSGMLKVTLLSRRRDDMTHAQYLAHWRDVHAPLFRSQPIVKKLIRRYVQLRITDSRPMGMFDSAVDGIAQLWFDDMAAYNEFYASDDYRNVIEPDQKRFTNADRCEAIFGHELVIIG
jgi:uncharacterized protein (TIGR02118 family)